jgi:O-acetyl-ADP-ribose deacetylase (regulator of RNase III)
LRLTTFRGWNNSTTAGPCACCAAIVARGRQTSLGRPYLPIGEALVVEVPSRPRVYVVSAPTMWLPHDVRGTHNAYHAMHAILRATSEHGAIERLVLCGLCTGCGKVPPAEAVAQMRLAWRDWREGTGPRWSPEDISAEQPRVYMNVEFEPSILQDLTRARAINANELRDIDEVLSSFDSSRTT